jgi:putative spermidine/putrescine transport system permease protein
MTSHFVPVPQAPLHFGAGSVRRRAGEWQLLALAAPAVLVVVLLLVVPLAGLAWLSFQGPEGFTLRHYQRIFTDPAYAGSLLLTLRLSLTVTAICALVGYPLCYMLTRLPERIAGICLLLVMVPFWTSLLVRTYSWLVLLQRRGIVNGLLQWAGLVDEPLYLVHNPTGAMIGMLHIMLPFFILPVYAALRRIEPDYLRAAASLGAAPMTAFWKVYFPLSAPGFVAGTLLVLVLCFGFYVTPALLGGGKTIVIPMMIERNVNLFFEWGAASSVAIVFLLAVLAVFALVGRLFSVNRLFGGH